MDNLIKALGNLVIGLAQYRVLGPGRLQFSLQCLRPPGAAIRRPHNLLDGRFRFGNRFFQPVARRIKTRTRGEAGFAQELKSLEMCQA